MTLPSRFLRYALLILAVLALGLWSLATIRFQTELLPLFPQNLSSVQVLKKAQASLVSEREVIVVARPGTNPGWAALQKIADKLAGQPGIASAQIGLGSKGSPSEWLAGLAAEMPADRFAAFAQIFTPASMEQRLHDTLDEMSGAPDETAMGRLHFDPLRMDAVLFPDPKTDPMAQSLTLPPVLTVASDRPLRTFEDDQKFVAQVAAALASASTGLTPAPDFLLTGAPAFTADISRQMKRDLIVMLVFTVVLISLAFWAAYRSLLPLAWIIVAQFLALLVAVTAGRFIFGELNVMSIGFSSILLGVGMDYCILVHHFFAQEGGVDRGKWLELRQAIWLSSATTAATFGVLYFSSFPGLRQLAVLVGVGLLATSFFATTILADLLARHRPHAPRWLTPASDAYARFLSRWRLAFRFLALILVVGALLLAPRLAHYPFYDASIEQLQPTEIRAYQAQVILEQALAQIPKQVAVPGDSEANRRAWVPLDSAVVQSEFQKAGFDATWSTPTVQMIETLNRWHAGQVDLTGADVANDAWISLRADLNTTAVRDFGRLSLVMLAIVIVLCAVAHRAIRPVILNLGALLLALLMLAGLLVLTQNSMTLVSLLCLPLMIGLVIDYSLHILLALEHEKGDLVAAFRHLAAPVMLTGLASIIGFTAPMLSSQPALQNFGNVMDLGTLAAVFSGLVLLPALYVGLKPVHQLAIVAEPHSKVLYRASMFSVAAWLARKFPLSATRALACTMGGVYAWTHPAAVTCVHRNLQLLDPAIARKNARQVYREFGRTMADYFFIGTRPPDDAVKIIGTKIGYEHLDRLRSEGRGAIIVTAHLGLFELGGLLMGHSGFPAAVLTLPEPSGALTRWRADLRRRWSVETIEVGADHFAFIEIARRLQRGYFVAALIDRPHASDPVPVRLPGGTAGFSTGILLVAEQARVPIVPATMVRQADDSYRAEVFAPFYIESRGTRAETLRFYSQQIADILQPTLCAHPEQWFQFVPLSPSA